MTKSPEASTNTGRHRPFAILCVVAPVLSAAVGLALVNMGSRSVLMLGVALMALGPLVLALGTALVSLLRKERSPWLLAAGIALSVLPAIYLFWQLSNLQVIR